MNALRHNNRQLELEALVAAVRALEALAHERTVARLKQESDDISTSVDDESYSLPYDPASVFLLETMVSITCQTSQHIDDLWYVFSRHGIELIDQVSNLGQSFSSISQHC
jgi:brefeldin A-resistance guanine nucleotide exchange factor 1